MSTSCSKYPFRHCKFFLLLIALLVPLRVYGGDYTLTISDDPHAPCTSQARKACAWCADENRKDQSCDSELFCPIHTADEVNDSLRLYFSGKEPKIKILFAAFSNGHLSFCTRKERDKVYETLMKIGASEETLNKRHVGDFIAVLPP